MAKLIFPSLFLFLICSCVLFTNAQNQQSGQSTVKFQEQAAKVAERYWNSRFVRCGNKAVLWAVRSNAGSGVVPGLNFFYTEEAPVTTIEREALSKTSADEVRKSNRVGPQAEWSGRSRVAIKKYKLIFCESCQLDHIWKSELSYSVGIQSVRGVWETFADGAASESVVTDPLFEDIAYGGGEVVSGCLLIGGNPNAVNTSGDTLLMTAATVGRAQLVEQLIDRDANVNDRHPNGWTASYLARLHDHESSARLLDRVGAKCVGPVKGVCEKFPFVNSSEAQLIADPVLIPPDSPRPAAPKGLLQRARILSKPDPEYTEEARKSGITGTVILQALLRPSGEVIIVRVVRGLPYGLTEKAIEAAKKLRFTPAIIDGRSVEVEMKLVYNFSL